jgi:integrase
MITEAIDPYVALRRAQGFVFKVQEKLLRSFARFASDRGEDHIRTATAIEWASESLSIQRRDHRLKIVAAFARYVQLEDPRHEVPSSKVFSFKKTRTQDLRNTFAVRALEACPEGRDNITRHMLALSTYMGHSSIQNTYWYLEATPHLMRDIAEACEALLNGEPR